MGELADVNDFIVRSRSIGSRSDLHGLVEAMAREIGYDYFSLIQLDMSVEHGRRSLISISSYPDAWIEEMQEQRLYENDPAYLASCRTSVGFRWSEIDRLIPMRTMHRDILSRSRRAGLADGFTVPAHIPGESNGLATFVVGPGRDLPERRLPMTQLVGSFAYEAARRLRRAPDAAAPPRLTQRQVDCVVLVARGKSDWEISRILGLAEDTVTEHLDSARRRYGVSRRSQLVVRALYDGWFSLTDALH